MFWSAFHSIADSKVNSGNIKMVMLKEKIIERMEAKNLSIAKLERRAGLKIHSVRNILKERIKKPSAQTLQAIAQALECSIIDLMSDSPSESRAFEPAIQ